MQEKQTCRICGEYVEFHQTDREVNNYILYICPECKTVFAIAKPPDLSNSAEYNELFSEGEYEMHRKQFEKLSQGLLPLEFHRQKLLRNIEKIIQGRKLVEIGGGVGSFGAFCVRNGWDYSDYDLSAVAVEYAQRLGLQAHVINDPSRLDLPSADVIVMWEVIEHIWNVHDYMKAIQKSLRPNGFLIISTPNYHRRLYRISNNWGNLASPPIHVNFFTEGSIANVLKSAGFEYVNIIKPRFYRSSLNLKSIWYNLQIALGLEPTKTLYVLARIVSEEK